MQIADRIKEHLDRLTYHRVLRDRLNAIEAGSISRHLSSE